MYYFMSFRLFNTIDLIEGPLRNKILQDIHPLDYLREYNEYKENHIKMRIACWAEVPDYVAERALKQEDSF